MRYTLLLLGFVLVWSLPHNARAQDLDLLRQGVVKVVPKSRSQGLIPATGFVVRAETRAVYIVTASHVVEGADEVGIEFFGARHLYPARVLGMEGGDPHGLAALIVEGDVPPDAVVLSINRDLAVRAADPVTMIGFPRNVGVPWAVTKGGIVGRRGKAIVFSGAVDPGNSGGPLVKDDQVVGVITQAEGQYAYATPSLIVQYALESWGVRFGVQLRSTPLMLHESELLRIVKAKGFNHPARQVVGYDLSMESVFGHFRHEYEPRTLNGDRVIIDHATGLMWQQSGSPGLDSYNEENTPHTYVEELNRAQHAGFADWRLPTIEELASLLEARGARTREDPVFNPPWSSVSADEVLVQAHYRNPKLGVDFEAGALFALQNRSFAVRAVRSLGAGDLRLSASPGPK